MEENKKKIRKKKLSRHVSSFSMRFDEFTLAMLDRVSWDEDKTRPEVIRAAIKLLYLKKHDDDELKGLRLKHRGDLSAFVLKGRIRVIADGREFDAGPRDGLYIPEGTPYECVAVSDEPADFVFGIAPDYRPSS